MSDRRYEAGHIRDVPREEREQLIGEVSTPVAQAVKQEDLANWKIMEAAIRMYLGLDDDSTEAALERQLEAVREERESLTDRLDDLREDVETLNEREEVIEEKLEETRERRQDYKTSLDEILDEMLEEPNKNILAWSSRLKELAKQQYGTATDSNLDTVVGDLRNRRDERTLAIQDHRFRRRSASRATGGSTAAATDGGESGTTEFRVLNRGSDDE